MSLQDLFYLTASIFFLLAIILTLWILLIIFLTVRKITQVQKEIERKANLITFFASLPIAGVIASTVRLVEIVAEKFKERSNPNKS